MARIKKTSKMVEDAKERFSGVKTIDNLDLGAELTLAGYKKWIDETEDELEKYNASLSVADNNQYSFEMKEKGLKDFHERMLLGIAAKFGKDSIEYEKAGGTRKSDRKKSSKTKAPV